MYKAGQHIFKNKTIQVQANTQQITYKCKCGDIIKRLVKLINMVPITWKQNMQHKYRKKIQ